MTSWRCSPTSASISFLILLVLLTPLLDRRNNPSATSRHLGRKLHNLFEIPRQGVTLIGGYSGSSEETLANQWSLHAANSGHVVCLASLELTPDYLFDFLAGQSACKHEPHESYLKRFGEWLDRKMYIIDHADVGGRRRRYSWSSTASGCLAATCSCWTA